MTPVLFSSGIKVELVSHMGADIDVARSAWVSTVGERAEDEASNARVKGVIGYLMKNRHGTPFEQCQMRWRVKAPIFVWREHMRHRIASYNEQSGRYGKLAPEFYMPEIDRNLIQVGKVGAYTFEPGSMDQWNLVYDSIREISTNAYITYERMLDAGIAPEVARMVLPVNIYSTAYVSMNLRALMNFLSLRTRDQYFKGGVNKPDPAFKSTPMHEIEQVALSYEENFMLHFPMVYDEFCANGRVAP